MENLFSRLANYVGIMQKEGIKQVTKYLAPKLVVKLTVKGKTHCREHTSVALTIGHPNYLEQKFIRKHRAAGGKFPVEPVQLKYRKAK